MTTLEEVARAALSGVAPDELEGFDLVSAAYAQNPAAARRAARGANEPTASATVLAGQTLSALTLVVSSGVAQGLLVTGVPRVLRGWDPRRLFRPAPGPSDPLPPVAPEDEATLESVLAESYRRHLDDPLAGSMASHLARNWPGTRGSRF